MSSFPAESHRLGISLARILILKHHPERLWFDDLLAIGFPITKYKFGKVAHVVDSREQVPGWQAGYVTLLEGIVFAFVILVA